MNTQLTQSQTEQVNTVTRNILARSARDFEFRQQLLTSPRAAMAEALGVDSSALPESFSLHFTEQPEIGGVLLPDYAGPDAELAESELETVSGGILGAVVLIGAVLMAMSVYEHDTDQCKV